MSGGTRIARVPVMREHGREASPGLPGRLPDGERVLWQGRPATRSVARRVCKTRWVLGYFALLAAWVAAAGLHDGQPTGAVVFSAGVITVMAALVLALLELFAWGVRRTTLYTITNRRIVMRVGVALSKTLNLPFARIDGLARIDHPEGTGSIAVQVDAEGPRLSTLILWPHVRPWHWKRPEPMLRCIPDADEAARILVAQLAKTHGQPVPVAEPATVGDLAGAPA